MSNEITYRSLAAVSIAEVQDHRSEALVNEVTSGRMYATIHRSSPRMPQSLRSEQQVELPARAPIDVFVIPKMG